MTTRKEILAKAKKLDKMLYALEAQLAEEESILEKERKNLEKLSALEAELAKGTAERREQRKKLRELTTLHAQQQQYVRELMEKENAYRDRITKATLKGLKRARAEGKRLGRPPGSGKHSGNIGRICALLKRGFTQQSIAQNLGCSQSLVSRRLKEMRKKLTPHKSKKSKTRRQHEHLQTR
jgi:AraC-like DNA-binding protein